MAWVNPQQIHEQTPADRNRYADLLRVAAILLVVFGHWMVRVVLVEDGELVEKYLITEAPWTQWATWLFQVMPVFFFIGGYANLQGWRSAHDRGESVSTWIRTRSRRLLRPLAPLIALWIALVAVLQWQGVTDRVLFYDAEDAIVPVWFLAAYLVVTAGTPLTARWHKRYGTRVLLVLVLGAVAVDALRFTLPGPLEGLPTFDGQPAFAVVNNLFVWVAIHQAGYLWRDGLLPRTAAGAAQLGIAGFVILLVAVTWLPYPLSMVHAPEAAANNHQPPTAALLALAAGQIGAALLLRPVVEPLLHRPRWWAPVVVIGSRIMTIFLWHQTAMLMVSSAVYPTGTWPVTTTVDAQWWATRPVWIALLALVLLVLVLIFGRCETTGYARPSRLPAPFALTSVVAGVSLTVAGLALLIIEGFAGPAGTAHLNLIPIATLIAGWLALGVLGPGRSRS